MTVSNDQIIEALRVLAVAVIDRECTVGNWLLEVPWPDHPVNDQLRRLGTPRVRYRVVLAMGDEKAKRLDELIAPLKD